MDENKMALQIKSGLGTKDDRIGIECDQAIIQGQDYKLVNNDASEKIQLECDNGNLSIQSECDAASKKCYQEEDSGLVNQNSSKKVPPESKNKNVSFQSDRFAASKKCYQRGRWLCTDYVTTQSEIEEEKDTMELKNESLEDEKQQVEDHPIKDEEDLTQETSVENKFEISQESLSLESTINNSFNTFYSLYDTKGISNRLGDIGEDSCNDCAETSLKSMQKSKCCQDSELANDDDHIKQRLRIDEIFDREFYASKNAILDAVHEELGLLKEEEGRCTTKISQLEKENKFLREMTGLNPTMEDLKIYEQNSSP